jgi:hypothetical protein
LDFVPELHTEIEEKLRLGRIQNEADVQQLRADRAIADVTNNETDLRDLSDI